MSVPAMQAVVARLLTDPAYQDRFFNDASTDHATHGLSPDELESLQRIDPTKLGIVSEGYTGKRLERVESCYPRTLRLLGVMQDGFWTQYLAHTPFPADDAGERSTFLDYIHANPHAWPPDTKRFLEDLTTLELKLHETPLPAGAPSYRLDPESTRPKRAGHVLRFHSLGRLLDAWTHAEAGQVPKEYPPDPSHWLVLRAGSGVRIESLFQNTMALLCACDGYHTVAMLEAEFGPAVRPRIQEWLRNGVVTDAATPDDDPRTHHPGDTS